MATVLLIDDDTLIRQVFTLALTRIGYRVVPAASVLAARDYLKTEVPDVILLDIMMPDINGLEALDSFKASARTRDVPVIVLTNLLHGETQAKAMAAGADAYVVKSNILPQELKEEIDRIISRKK